MAKAISTKQSTANINTLLNSLRRTPVNFAAWGAARSEDQCREPLGEGERSLVEDLAHLIHCEADTSYAITMALMIDQPLIHDLHPERDWGRLLKVDALPFDDLLAYFRVRRAILLRVLESLTDDQWERSIREHGKKRQQTVYRLVRSLALHELDHLTDLEAKLNS